MQTVTLWQTFHWENDHLKPDFWLCDYRRIITDDKYESTSQFRQVYNRTILMQKVHKFHPLAYNRQHRLLHCEQTVFHYYIDVKVLDIVLQHIE